MFTLCADDLVVGLSSLVLVLLSTFTTTLDFKTAMVVLGGGETLCTDIIDDDDSSVGLLSSLVLL